MVKSAERTCLTYMRAESAEHALETYKLIRRRFLEAGERIFGPGVMSMAEYYFFHKNGKSPFSLLFSEPLVVYQEWVNFFKGQRPVEKLLEGVIGPAYLSFIEDMKRNDAIRIWSALERVANNPARANLGARKDQSWRAAA